MNHESKPRRAGASAHLAGPDPKRGMPPPRFVGALALATGLGALVAVGIVAAVARWAR